LVTFTKENDGFLKNKFALFDSIILSLTDQIKTPNEMTTLEFTKIATVKFAGIPTNDLIQEYKKLMLDYSDAADLVSQVIIDILFDRMTEAEFIQFEKQL
jgi:hypothetical protein